jgi:ABC-type transport system, involved in lipoprotein release, permease component
LAKKSHNLINIITWISIISISVGTFALIVVLSAFNGIESLVSEMSHKLSPDLMISPSKGKSIDLTSFPSDDLKAISGIDFVIPTITEDALFRANDKQHIGSVKGVGSEYQDVERLGQAIMNDRDFVLSENGKNYAVPGAGVAWHLGISAYDPFAIVRVYVPRRGNAFSFNMENSFNSGLLNVISVFSTEQEIDERMVLVPMDWLAELLGYQDKATEVELFLSPEADFRKIKNEVKLLLGDGFKVKDQFEQQETLFKIMRSEKWAIYVILTFILILATFNVVGSLSMLIIDKRKDVAVLASLGANKSFFYKLFMSEGVLISILGGVIGLLLGIVMVVLQQQFGFVKFGSGGSYVVEIYPVALKIGDIIAVFATIIVIGGTSAFLTVRLAMKRLQSIVLRSK